MIAAINAEVLQEILYRYSHIQLVSKGVQLCRDILKYPLTILPVTEADIRVAVDLFDTHRVVGLGPRDSIHAATMQNNNITRLLSADKDFNHLDFVVRIDPLAYVS
ncbi:MAG: type II toxin-antitoxin system VapC family toxin [Chloroflexota bacterium]|nr:type II toxin-antitoxin system VapC family toxin [Chloroflexota bacterium]